MSNDAVGKGLRADSDECFRTKTNGRQNGGRKTRARVSAD
jgi:hypothetical protein